ncbi:unnamed protein product [Dibothriocephalus latus]|uniref:GST N-terminal domain-containing protein n=1 Tax=Dibothriocephalus latus TaxID=60516 RepID=A0A3P6TZE0_DIBLA|nr:unnamed protein product [Dibothriocephalus latus]
MKKCPDAVAIQLMFAHLQLPHKEVTIKKDQWPIIREEILTKRVPALRIERPDGGLTWLNESKGIVRCIGAAYDLLGKDEMEKYYIVETSEPLFAFYRNKNYVDDLKELRNKLFEDLTPILRAKGDQNDCLMAMLSAAQRSVELWSAAIAIRLGVTLYLHLPAAPNRRPKLTINFGFLTIHLLASYLNVLIVCKLI